MNQTRYLELDFYRTGYRFVKAHQYDKDTRFIEVTCVNDASAYPLDPAAMTCDLKLVTPDNRHMLKQETIQENGTVLVALEESMLLTAGICKAELNVYDLDNHRLLSTMPFDLIVIGSVYDNSIIEESDEFSALNEILFYNKELGDRLEQLEDNAEDAEAVRENNESTRMDHETRRINAENARIAEEQTRTSNEDARKDSESHRQAAETERVNSESVRLSAESDRNANEAVRETNEDARQNEEAKRMSAEVLRKTNEDGRKAGEAARNQSETARASAEMIREQDETARNTAESKREANFKSMQDVNAEELKKMQEAGSASEIASAEYAADARESKEAAKVSEVNSKESEGKAKASETASAGYADSASQKSNEAGSFAAAAESFAHGGTGTRDGEDEDNGLYYYNKVKGMTERLSNALVPKGTITSEQLLAITDAEPGDLYNISDEFATTDAFEEGSGHLIGEGSNVYLTDSGKWDVQAGTSVTGIKGTKETVYRKGNVNLSAVDIGAVAVDSAKGQWVESTSALTAGSASRPVYFDNGIPTPIGITFAVVSALPSDAASHPDTLYIITD